MAQYLMHKDIYVAEIELSKFHIIEVFNHNHLPIGVQGVAPENMDDCFKKWFLNRSISADHPRYKMLLEKAKVYGVEDIPNCRFLSLTDCYWVKTSRMDERKWKHIVNSRMSWKNMNFRSSGLLGNLGKFLAGYDEAFRTFSVPEITTSGHLPKRWIRGQNGTFYLLKGETPFYHEILNEAFAYQYAELLGLDAVPYAIYEDGDKRFSICPSFLKVGEEEFVSMEQICISLGGNKEMALRVLFNGNYAMEIFKMRVFDYLIGNSGRSMNDVGIIRDANTLAVKRFAPLFDHGNSMVVNGEYYQQLTDYKEDDELYSLRNADLPFQFSVKPKELVSRMKAAYGDAVPKEEIQIMAEHAVKRLDNIKTAMNNRERGGR